MCYDERLLNIYILIPLCLCGIRVEMEDDRLISLMRETTLVKKILISRTQIKNQEDIISPQATTNNV